MCTVKVLTHLGGEPSEERNLLIRKGVCILEKQEPREEESVSLSGRSLALEGEDLVLTLILELELAELPLMELVLCVRSYQFTLILSTAH